MPLNNPISNSDLIQPGLINKYYTAEEKAAIQAQILAVNGSPKGVFATVAALEADATANTADGKKSNYLVTADGKWYYWGGVAWLEGGVYQATGLSDAEIARQKLVNDIQGTTQTVAFNADGTVASITHKNASNVTLRTDVFTYATNLIIEVRTLNTLETITFKYHTDTLQTEVI